MMGMDVTMILLILVMEGFSALMPPVMALKWLQ